MQKNAKSTIPINRYPAQIITPQELPRLRRKLSKSWIRAAGLLRRRRKALERHLKKVRLEWNRSF